MKAIMMSIKPKYAAKILNGEKTIEVRKSMPKCDLPIDVYIYCTKEEYLICDLYTGKARYHNIPKGKNGFTLSGKVVAKFTLNKVEEIKFNDKNIQEKSCLSEDELFDYLFDNTPYQEDMRKGYAWQIEDLEIFDKPKELGEFMPVKWDKCGVKDKNGLYQCNKCPYGFSEGYYCECRYKPLTKAPQSFMFIEAEE